MKINDLHSIFGRVIKKAMPQDQKVQLPADKSTFGDSLEISGEAKLLDELVKRAAAVPEDSTRVERIKEQVTSGAYKVDPREIAQSMLNKE